MPTYTYKCNSCGLVFDEFQSVNDEPLTDCPNCGSSLHKVFGNVGVVFKGSGFYKNDSKSTQLSNKSKE